MSTCHIETTSTRAHTTVRLRAGSQEGKGGVLATQRFVGSGNLSSVARLEWARDAAARKGLELVEAV